MTTTPRPGLRHRYSDPFLNALTFSHQVTSRGELFFNNVKVDDLTFISGTVNGDRGASVRRTFSGDVDPRRSPLALDDPLTPYGARLVVYRGVRFPNGDEIEYPVFSGRVDVVNFGLTQLTIQASDRAAELVDARFEAPRKATRGMRVVDQIAALITDVIPDAVIVDSTGSTQTISTPATWDRERTEAMDNLAQTIGAQWYAGPDGKFYITSLPVIGTTAASWVIDSGDTGVAITRTSQTDRAQVYNAVVVNGEPPDGKPPAYGLARDNDPNSPTRWGGPFGKVPRFFSSQFITTNAQANAVALDMLADAIAGTRSVSVSCISNPRLETGDVVYLATGAGEFDGMYFVNTFTLPLEPETPMTLGCNLALQSDPVLGLVPASVQFAQEVLWRP